MYDKAGDERTGEVPAAGLDIRGSPLRLRGARDPVYRVRVPPARALSRGMAARPQAASAGDQDATHCVERSASNPWPFVAASTVMALALVRSRLSRRPRSAGAGSG